jgi:hypothetical protein
VRWKWNRKGDAVTDDEKIRDAVSWEICSYGEYRDIAVEAVRALVGMGMSMNDAVSLVAKVYDAGYGSAIDLAW